MCELLAKKPTRRNSVKTCLVQCLQHCDNILNTAHIPYMVLCSRMAIWCRLTQLCTQAKLLPHLHCNAMLQELAAVLMVPIDV